MNDELPSPLESNSRFPSGDWIGFYLQYWMPGRHQMDMTLAWQNGEVTGSGEDRVGPFTIRGTFDIATGACEWKKQYVGKHSVQYRGMNDGSGIWGVWEIRQLGGLYRDRGGFHIWPKGTNVSEESDATERAVVAAMRAEFGTMPLNPALVILYLLVGAGLAFLVWWRLMP